MALFLYLFISFLAHAEDPIEVDVGSPQVFSVESQSIIDEHQIETTFAASSEDSLRVAPGLIVSRAGGVGQAGFVFIRGADSADTLVLLDGVAINDPSTPNATFDFSVLSLENIERIEIWKGPQSVLFGSGAVGGVINFVTKKGHGPMQATAGVEVGSWNTTRADLSTHGSSGAFAYSLTAERFQTNGISASSEPIGPTLERDGSASDTYSARLGWTPTKSSEIELLARWEDKLTDLDDAPITAVPYLELDALKYQTSEQNLNLALHGAEKWTSDFESTLLLSQSQIDRYYSNDPDPNNPLWLRSHYGGVGYQVTDSNRWTPNRNWAITLGADGRLDGGASQSFTNTTPATLQPRQWISVFGVMGRTQWQGDRFFAMAGAREDESSRFGGQGSYEVEPGIHLTETTDASIRYATAYKAPAIYELYGPIYGNTDLQPEHVTGFEAALTQYFAEKRLKMVLTGFHYHYHDLIQPLNTTYANVDEAIAQGVEFVGALILTNVHLDVGYTYLETRDDLTGQSLLRRPRNSFSARLEVFPLRKLSGVLEWTGMDHRLDIDPQSNQQVVDTSYQVWNASIIWRASEDWKFFVRAQNLLNLQYQELAGYSTYPFSLYAGATYTFQNH